MARLLTIEPIDKSPTLNFFKKKWNLLQSFDKFTRLMVLTVTLILVSTPFIVANRQIFNPRAEQLVDESLCPSIPIEQGIEKPDPQHVSDVTGLLSEAHKGLSERGSKRSDSSSNDQAQARQFAASRKSLLVELMRKNPDQALEHIVSNSQKQEFSNMGVPSNCIESQETIEGQLEILHQDFFEEGTSIDQYTLVTSENKRIGIHPAKGFDLGNTPHISGVNLKISGYRLDNDLLFDGSKKENINVLPSKKSSMNLLTKPAYANHDEYHTKIQEDARGEQKVAVIMVNFQDIASPPAEFNKANVNDLVFNQMKNFYVENSYGKIPNITGNIFPASQEWYTLAENQNCSFLQTAINMADSEINFADYDHIIYVTPTACASAIVGKTNSIVTQDGAISISYAHVGITRYKTIFFHEFGHQLGVRHANALDCDDVVLSPQECSNREYGNRYDVMGNAGGHLNASSKDYLGWLDTSNIQTVTTNGIYTIEPIEKNTVSAQAIKIPHSRNTDVLYMEYRQPIGFDAPLSPSMLGAVLHASGPSWSVDKTVMLNASPPLTAYGLNPILGIGQAFTDYASGATIKVLDQTASALRVEVTLSNLDFTIPSSSIAISPSAISPGDPISFSGDVKNLGGGKVDIHVPQRLRIDYGNDGIWDVYDKLTKSEFSRHITDNVLLPGGTENIIWNKDWVFVGYGKSSIGITKPWTVIGTIPGAATRFAVAAWQSNWDQIPADSNFTVTFGDETCIRSDAPWTNIWSYLNTGKCIMVNNLGLDVLFDSGYSISFGKGFSENYCDFRYTAATRLVEFKDDSLSIDCDFAVFSDVPMLAQEGTHNLEICTDPENVFAESDETNNCATKLFSIPPPDLVISDLSTSTTTMYPGGNISVPNTLKNQGTGSAGSSSIAFHLSTDAVYGGTDDIAFVNTRTVSSLAVGATSSSTTWTMAIPSTTPLGTYYICAMADNGQTVPEESETNNSLCTTSTIKIALSDILVTALSGPSTSVKGSSISLTTTIVNQGEGLSPSVDIGYYLSTDANITTSDARISTLGLSSGLAPSETKISTISGNVLSTLAAGSYYLGAIADYNSAVTESNETNNTFLGNTISVTVVDLIISDLSTSTTTMYPGGNISVPNTLKNQGTGSAGSSTIAFHLSTDAVYGGTNDIAFVNTRTVSSLAAGATSSSTTWTMAIPSTTPLGTYYICAMADNGQTVSEESETNNSLCTTSTIKVALPDLVVSALSGLVAHWKFDEGVGLVASDSSGINNNGALQGGINDTNWIPGKLGTALDFNGISNGNIIIVPDSSSLRVSSALTFAVWINPDTTSGENVILHRWISDTRSIYALRMDSGTLRFVTRSCGGVNNDLQSSAVVSPGQWQHVAITFDDAANTVSLYHNGVNVLTSTAYTGVPCGTNPGNIEIGGHSGPSAERWFDGKIDDLQVYNRALTSSEIIQVYQEGAGSPTPPPPSPTPTPTPTPAPCAIISASWNTTSNPVTEGAVVNLSATTNNSSLCAGKQVAFEVRENDSLLEGLLDEAVTANPSNASIAGSTASTIWTSEYQQDGLFGIFDPPEYFFNASLTDDPSVKTRSLDPLLSVNQATGGTPVTQPASAIYFPPAGQSITFQNQKTPQEVGLNSNIVTSIKSKFTQGRWALWRHGYLVHVEGNFNTNAADIRSARKTMHAATIGGLIQQGKINSMNQLLTDWNAGITGGPGNCHLNATLFNGLTQTTAFDEPGLCPGNLWAYSDTNPHVVNRVAARAFRGTNATDYNINYNEVIGGALFNPIGATGWNSFDGGDGIRLSMDLEDLGRVGTLMISGGMWGNTRVLPLGFADQIGSKQTRGITPNFDNANDGGTEFCLSTQLEASFPSYDQYVTDDPCHAQGFSESPYGLFTWVNTDQDLYPGVSPNWAVTFGVGNHYLTWDKSSGIVFALLQDNGTTFQSTDPRPGWVIPFGTVVNTIESNITGQNPLVGGTGSTPTPTPFVTNTPTPILTNTPTPTLIPTSTPIPSPIPPTLTPTPTLPPSGQGILAYWNFDEGIGLIANDSSGNGYNGNLIGGLQTGWTIGRFGNALNFDGINDYVDVTSSIFEILPANSSATMSMWIKPNSLTGALFRSNFGGNTYGRWGITLDGRVRASLRAKNLGLYRHATGTTKLTLGQWYFVVAVYDRLNQQIRIYLNGAQEGATSWPNTDTLEPSDGKPDSVGGGGPGFVPFRGIIDDIKVYFKALTGAEINQLYQTGSITP